MIPYRHELPTLFGAIENGIWTREKEFLVTYNVPKEFNLKFNGLPVKHISVNKVMLPAFTLAMNNVKNNNLASELKTFDGCFMVRNTRGADLQSVHSWALAVDFNASTNKLGVIGDMSTRVVSCFERAGFVWGGDFKRMDYQHFQYVIED